MRGRKKSKNTPPSIPAYAPGHCHQSMSDTYRSTLLFHFNTITVSVVHNLISHYCCITTAITCYPMARLNRVVDNDH